MYCDKQKFEFHTKGKVIRTCEQYLREGFKKIIEIFKLE